MNAGTISQLFNLVLLNYNGAVNKACALKQGGYFAHGRDGPALNDKRCMDNTWIYLQGSMQTLYSGLTCDGIYETGKCRCWLAWAIPWRMYTVRIALL